jgi:hypothetical protein
MPVPGALSLQKAALTVVDGSGVPPLLKFGYNPTEYTVTKSARWNRPPTRGAESSTPPEFTGSMPTTISMEIFFDAFEELAGDVSRDVETLLVWTRPTPVSISRGLAQPPLLRFIWGSNPVLQDFQGYLKSVTARYTMFRLDGTPVRATASITLEEVTPEAARQNPTSGSREGRRSCVLSEGDTLQALAWREYGQASLWRGLAAFNAIDDPMRLVPGRELLIPTRAEAERLEAEGRPARGQQGAAPRAREAVAR